MKYPALAQLKTAYKDTLQFALEQVVKFSKAALDAIKEVEAAKSDKRNAVSVTIPTSGWTSDTSVSAYPYKYEISVSSITAKDLVIINISPGSQATAIACGLCPTNETVAGKIRIRAVKTPSTSMQAEYWIEKGKEE